VQTPNKPMIRTIMSLMKIAVIIPAAGQSSRFGTKDKLAEDLGGRPLLLRTVEFFTKREDVVEIVVAGPAHDFEAFNLRFGAALSFHGVHIVKGGLTERWESVKNALEHITTNVDRIVVHDAARPALTNTLFDRLLIASKELNAVALAVAITGTVKRSTNDPVTIGDDDAIADSILGTSTQEQVTAFQVQETIDRTNLWELQTPQIFEPSLLRRGYDQSSLVGVTDDAQVIEKLGVPVFLIDGDNRNIKVTTQADLQLVKALLGVKGEKQRPAHKRF